jgi:hypothetical protein
LTVKSAVICEGCGTVNEIVDVVADEEQFN